MVVHSDKLTAGRANFYVHSANKKAHGTGRRENIHEPPKTEDTLLDNTEKQESKAFIYDKKPSAPKVRREITPEEVQAQKESIEAAAKGFQILIKCVRIAFRIIRGDNVPMQDNKLLAENYPDMHFRAWSLRQVKQNPEDCESELEEEDEGTTVSDGGGEVSLDMEVEALDVSV